MLFKDIVGHAEIKSRLIQTVQENRISHAQLFLGEEGSGNLALAIAYAQYISCEQRTPTDACGVCSSCIKHEKFVHPDVHFVFPVATNATIKKNPISSNFSAEWRELLTDNSYISLADWQEKLETGNKQLLISKDESASIVKTLSLKTYESEYKTVIIWYPEKFNTSSANKLLKILEEPPQKTLFLLVAQHSEQIISTILSRTQLVKVGKIDMTSMTAALKDKYAMNEQEAIAVARMADGNFIQAQQFISANENQQLYHGLFTSWVRAAFKGDIPRLIDWTEELSKSSYGREKQKQFLKYALHVCRESLIKNFGHSDLERTVEHEDAFLLKFSPYIHGANSIDIIHLFEEAHYHIERNVNPKVLFLDVSLKLTKLLRVPNPSAAR